MNGFAMNHRKAAQTKPTAAECYSARHAEAQSLLKLISRRLEEHKAKQAKEPADWGYAGDLGHVNNELAYILAALGDRSAVEAKGLEC